ncbi:D-isomer specific 2-hydroxyacid dehydrogenase [Enterococcus sp. AZ194]|uniref:D-isomer specific 2-hydroxyacid dehydrogenase family protein n=1 Tax=Enterococcus sp. AZ194 TaxID=2774629 RepID=UPI003F21FB8B
MTDYKIAVVNSSSFGKVFTKHLDDLKEIGKVKFFTVDSEMDGKELANLLQGFNIVIASVTPFFDKEFFSHKDELYLISRHGIGFNNIDIEAARAHDTVVAIVPALVERDAVAENNITNLLSLLRCTARSYSEVKNDHWENRAAFVGRSLFNKTVGVIGVGNTGSAVVEILRNGFRCDVLAYDPFKSDLYIQSFGAKKVSLDELLNKSDIICLCANLTEENYHMLSNDELDKMKTGVFISNSARGALLDEQAVVCGLSTGKIKGLATDVLEEEPGRNNHPYLEFDNVIMTPHTSAYTHECLEKMGEKCVDDVKRIVKGELPDRAVQSSSKYLVKKGSGIPT